MKSPPFHLAHNRTDRPVLAPSPIRQLPNHLVDRIAAGEVIERPAAVAKELVENALDAGARRITVELERGGIDRLEVTDDGCGMDPAGLALCVGRHCTSKLADDQLVHITTLGFRGEALPSIGAAARLQITTRPAAAAHGWRIRLEGGVVSVAEPAAGPVGTQILVTDLFFATPARRNFLKSARVEADQAEAAVRRLALAAPAVAMRLVSDGRVVFDLPRQEPLGRAAALLGLPPETLLPLEADRHGLQLFGHAAPATATRATATGQSVVVNGRPVLDPLLRLAVRLAYRDVIPPGRHAVAALWLTVPPDAVDVNVHPAKTELRFRDPDAVRGLVIGGLRRALATGTAAPLAMAARRPGGRPAWARPAAPWQGGFAEALPSFGSSFEPSARSLLADAPPIPAQDPAPDPAQVLPQDPAHQPQHHPLGAALAQLADTYVMAVTTDGSLVLVDQHAAHERLTHEALAAQHKAGGVRAQPLLLPAVVDLPAPDAARLLAAAPACAALGLELEGFGPGAVLVRALPALLCTHGAPDPAALLRDLADELQDGEAVALEGRIDAAIARLACHGSVRAGRRLNAAEMNALLRQLETTPRAATCSHGRPTVLKLSRDQLEALFSRR